MGQLALRLVETRDEAEAPDHCFCGNSRIFEHLSLCEVADGYPSLLVRSIDISDEHQNAGHGSALLKFAEDFAFRKRCVFAYCKLDMSENMDEELQSFYLKAGWNLIEETTQERIYQPDPDAGFVMGYITPRLEVNLDICGYHAEEKEVPEWEKQMKPTRYIPE